MFLIQLANGASNSSPVPESSPGGTTADANGDAEESSDEESKQRDWGKYSPGKSTIGLGGGLP